MNRNKARIGVLIALAGILVLWGLISQPISRTMDSPLIRRMSDLVKLVGKLRTYADVHSTFPDGSLVNSNIDGLVEIGVFLAKDADYVRTNHIMYHGFVFGHATADVAVFECVFSNTKSPRRIIAYGDGHVVTKDLSRAQ